MFTQLLSQPPIPLNSARPNLDFGGRVESAMMRALAREPAERYPDVLAFARELHSALTSVPSPASPAGGGAGGGAGTGGTEEGLFSRVKGLFRRPGS